MKKIISIILAIVMCLSLGTTAFADSGVTPAVETYDTNEIQPYFIRTATKYISSYDNICFTVVYTFNDSDGSITGLQSATITSYPQGFSGVKITDYVVTNTYILFYLQYWYGGICYSDSAKCWAG